MKNKGLLIAVISISLIVLGWWFWKKKNQESSNKELVKIGCIYPLTGNGAQYGSYFKMGTELAYTYAQKKGIIQKEQIKFIFEDGQGDATKSISALNNLIATSSISALLTDLSSVIVPIKPVVNSKKIPTINSSSFSTNIEDNNDYMYSILPNADSYAKQIAEYSYNNLKKKRAIIIYRNDDMGLSFNKVFQDVFKSLGGEIVYFAGHEKDEKNYESIVQQIKQQKDVDIIFCASYGVEAARLIKQLKENNYTNQYITFQGFIIPEVFEIGGNSSEGTIILGSKFNLLNDGKIQEIETLSSENYNINKLNFYTAAHFDATMMLIDAVSKGYNTSNKIKELFDSEGYIYRGLTGDLVFNRNGLVNLKLVPYKVSNKNFIPIN